MDPLLGTHSAFQNLNKDIRKCNQILRTTRIKLPGSRELRKDEPLKEVSHHFFMMKEMENMALEIQSEYEEKRWKMARLAYEAQEFVMRKALNAKKAKESVIEGLVQQDAAPLVQTSKAEAPVKKNEDEEMNMPIPMPPLVNPSNYLDDDDPFALPAPIGGGFLPADDFDAFLTGPAQMTEVAPIPQISQ